MAIAIGAILMATMAPLNGNVQAGITINGGNSDNGTILAISTNGDSGDSMATLVIHCPFATMAPLGTMVPMDL